VILQEIMKKIFLATENAVIVMEQANVRNVAATELYNNQYLSSP
jgi:hypothetical protein